MPSAGGAYNARLEPYGLVPIVLTQAFPIWRSLPPLGARPRATVVSCSSFSFAGSLHHDVRGALQAWRATLLAASSWLGDLDDEHCAQHSRCRLRGMGAIAIQCRRHGSPNSCEWNMRWAYFSGWRMPFFEVQLLGIEHSKRPRPDPSRKTDALPRRPSHHQRNKIHFRVFHGSLNIFLRRPACNA